MHDPSRWTVARGDGPFVAAAIHASHAVRDEVAELFALDDSARLREEDPYTDEWTLVAPTRVVGRSSRFQVDLNRPRDRAIYRRPEDAWGLAVWKGELPEAVAAESLVEYDAFYSEMRELFEALEREHGRFLVFDLHSYNHRRAGPEQAPADPATDPQVNVGTGTLDRQRWAAVIDTFIGELAAVDFPGGSRLDVRENVKFQGGNFSRWIHQTFPTSGVSLAIELKKFFMDEWTGVPDREAVDAIGAALSQVAPAVLAELERV